jgi:hypothetical protein
LQLNFCKVGLLHCEAFLPLMIPAESLKDGREFTPNNPVKKLVPCATLLSVFRSAAVNMVKRKHVRVNDTAARPTTHRRTIFAVMREQHAAKRVIPIARVS